MRPTTARPDSLLIRGRLSHGRCEQIGEDGLSSLGDAMSGPWRSAFGAHGVIGGPQQPNAATGGFPREPRAAPCAEYVPKRPAAKARPPRLPRSTAEHVSLVQSSCTDSTALSSADPYRAGIIRRAVPRPVPRRTQSLATMREVSPVRAEQCNHVAAQLRAFTARPLWRQVKHRVKLYRPRPCRPDRADRESLPQARRHQ